jgi:heme-degrading monooxygenase HmoA
MALRLPHLQKTGFAAGRRTSRRLHGKLPAAAGEAQMIAVIFEVEPAEGQMDIYLDHAAALRPELECMPGFISVERFRSLTNPDKLLSLSFWTDDSAIGNWRTHPEHRAAQHAGRNGVFAGYRLRVAHVLRDYGLHHNRGQAPADSQAAHGD